MADNGSDDSTWTTLTERCTLTPMRLRALRLPFHDGPAVPRNTCIAEARGVLIAFTDDDCLPTKRWLTALSAAFDVSTAIVQGRTIPEPRRWEGPWQRSLEIQSPSGLYETANLAAKRESILEAGGFRADRLLSGRPFGEDVLLGAAIARTSGFRFAPEALVHHRVMPGRYRDFLEERRRLAGFPKLLREVPELRDKAFARVFLSRRTAITDLGLAGVVTCIICGLLSSPVFLVGFIAALVWFDRLIRENRARFGWRRSGLGRLLAADVVGFGALIAGSVRARRILL